LEMSMGNTGSFWINGQEFTDEDLPLKIEGNYSLKKKETIQDDKGTVYMLQTENVAVKLIVMKFIMGVDVMGQHPSYSKGTGGLLGKFPSGDLLGRDGKTVFAFDDEMETLDGRTEPICNAIGQEWQVRDTDPQLFREIRAPTWPEKCNFPVKTNEEIKRRRLSSSIDMSVAAKACASRHAEGSEAFDFCVMDVLMMDNVDAAYSW